MRGSSRLLGSIRFLVLLFLVWAVCGTDLAAEVRPAEVVLGYDAIAKWTEEAAGKPAAEKNALFERMVIEPYKQRCFAGPSLPTDDMRLTGMVFGNPAGWDLAQVKKEVEELGRHGDEIRETIGKTVAEARRRLTAKSELRACVFYFQPDSPVRGRMNGVMAFTPSAALIDLYVAPVEGWMPWLAYNVAHEYSHTQWMARNPERDTFQFTLLEYLVFEGRADNFASQVTQLDGAWSHSLAPSQECSVFREIRAALGQKGAILPKVMFGWPGSGYPQWAGYSMGFGIVNGYLRSHPKATPEEWINLSAEDLYASSGYQPCASEREPAK